MEWTFESDGAVEADVVVPAGTVEVERADGNEVWVLLEAVRDSRRTDEAIAASEVTLVGGKLRVHVPERTFRNIEVRCRVRVPDGSGLATKTASADVRSSTALRAYDGATASGDVELIDVTGDATHKSASGDFACEAIGGKLRLRTASGDVSVRQTVGDADLALASGDVHVGDAGASVKVKSASGDVRLDRVRRERVNVETASGDISIAVADGVGAYLDVTTMSGETSCTLPFQEGAAGPGVVLEIVARTVSGDIVVKGAGR